MCSPKKQYRFQSYPALFQFFLAHFESHECPVCVSWSSIAKTLNKETSTMRCFGYKLRYLLPVRTVSVTNYRNVVWKNNWILIYIMPFSFDRRPQTINFSPTTVILFLSPSQCFVLQLFYYVIEWIDQFSLHLFLPVVNLTGSYINTIPQVGPNNFLRITSKTDFFIARNLFEFGASMINNWI